MKKLLFITFLLSSLSIYAQNDKRLKGIDKDLNRILNLTKTSGFSVAIVEGDKIIYSKGFGYRDFENKLPVNANTLFPIGSCTKAFTAAILGQLRKENKLSSFNDSPIKYISELKFYNEDLNKNIIIKDLLSHRTGIPRHDYSWGYFPASNKDSIITRIQFLEPYTGLRQKWCYNNFMYVALGVIAERITGKSWEKNIQERFFKPLEMNRSSVTLEGLQNDKNYAFGYGLENDKIVIYDYADIHCISPVGAINSSANEMSNWVIAWLNEGKFKGKQIIPKKYIKEAISSHAVIYGHLPSKKFPEYHFENYGYAWFLSSYRGNYKVEHGGNISGFSANVIFYPSDTIGIVILTNQNNSDITELARNVISDRMLRTKRKDWIGEYEKKIEKKDDAEIKTSNENIPNGKPIHSLNDYTGIYYHPGYGEFEIIQKSDSLFANFKQMKFHLKHIHYDIFEPYKVINGKIETELYTPLFNFITNKEGKVNIVEIDFESKLNHPIRFKRKAKK